MEVEGLGEPLAEAVDVAVLDPTLLLLVAGEAVVVELALDTVGVRVVVVQIAPRGMTMLDVWVVVAAAAGG